jgi:hypothetical protein
VTTAVSWNSKNDLMMSSKLANLAVRALLLMMKVMLNLSVYLRVKSFEVLVDGFHLPILRKVSDNSSKLKLKKIL